MTPNPEFVTVYRSADPSAADSAAAVLDLLVDAGLSPMLLNDEAPGVPQGAWEVRVPQGEEAQAELALLEAEAQVPQPVDNSHSLDLLDLFEGVGPTGELDALGIRSVLDAAGIPSVLSGSPQIPNLPFTVKVPAALFAAANAALDEAAANGPEAAEEAEAAAEAAS